MKEERSQNVTMKNEAEGRGLFYGVIAVAVFIIMAVGTTFAYFTATTNSADDSVKTGSTTLELSYISYEGAWLNGDLIPANTEVVEYSFEYQSDTTVDTSEDDYETLRHNALCKDDYGNSICSVYVFQVGNTANSPQAVSLDVVTKVNGFASLNAMAYEISEPTAEDTENYGKYFPTIPEGGSDAVFSNPLNGLGDPEFSEVEPEEGVDGAGDGTVVVRNGKGELLYFSDYNPVYVNRDGVVKKLLQYNNAGKKEPATDRALKVLDESKPDEKTARIADNITIDGGSIKTFALVLYIKNDEKKDQTDTDANKTFSGQVVVGPGDGSGGVSGSIEMATKDDLFSEKMKEELAGGTT